MPTDKIHKGEDGRLDRSELVDFVLKFIEEHEEECGDVTVRGLSEQQKDEIIGYFNTGKAKGKVETVPGVKVDYKTGEISYDVFIRRAD